MKSSNNNKNWGLPLLAALLIPLNPNTDWTHYQFSGKPQNSVSFENKAMVIQVNQSASPLLHAFKEVHTVSGIKLTGEIETPLPEVPKTTQQGARNADDYILRFGLILKGEERLNWLQRRLAPRWLTDMEELLPKKWGIKKVLFLTTCRQKTLLNKVRQHFMSDRFEEKCVTFIDKAGPFKIEAQLESPEAVIGLWLGSDGDDLKQSFRLKIKEIQINYSKTAL